ncbi:mechanosensitive ion channel domain-containing protein [Kaarinaea lacus]
MKKFIICLCLCLYATFSVAESVEPEIPNPVALSSDWWGYFEPAVSMSPEELNKRIAIIKQKLNVFLDKSDHKHNAIHATLISQIDNQLNKFLKLKTAEVTIETPLYEPLDSYSLNDALARFSEWRQLNQDYQASKEDIDWHLAVISEERKQQSRRRNQYLEMGKNDSLRFTKGLELMASRLKLELQRIESDRQKVLLNSIGSKLENIQAELKIIPQRLTVLPKEAEQWHQEYDRTQSALSELRAKTDKMHIADAEVDIDNVERQMIQARYTVLVGVYSEVEAAALNFTAIRSRLALEIIKILNQKEKADTGKIREILTEFQQLQEHIEDKLSVWNKASQRLQSYASSLTDEQVAANPNVAKLKKKALELFTNIEKAQFVLAQEQAKADYFFDLLKYKLEGTEGWIKRGVKDTTHAAEQTWQVAIDLLGSTLFEINEVPVTMLGLLRIVLILVIAWWLSKGIRNGLHRIGERRTAVSKSSLYTLGRIIHYIILIIGVVIGLSSIGIDFTKFALFASALGVGIGFGLQTLISNFVSGLIILFEKSLKVGDFVELASGLAGEVREINMRSTLITTNDNIDILVPNSEFVAGRVTNWTLREAHRRIHVPFGVAYGTDKDLVRKAVLEAADAVQWTLKGKKGRIAQVWFVQFGDSSLNFELVVWLTPEAVKRPSAVQADYLWEIETKLNQYGIEIPFPQRDLHLRSAFGKKDEDGLSLLPGSAIE